jgi:hypothetical protein
MTKNSLKNNLQKNNLLSLKSVVTLYEKNMHKHMGQKFYDRKPFLQVKVPPQLEVQQEQVFLHNPFHAD